MFDQNGWLIIAAAWLICSFGSGALLATLYKRLHPSLSFHRLWAFWTVVTSLLAAVLYLIGLI
jgi:hypothetical protein